MKIEKLTGLWKGNYRYGNTYPIEYKDKVEPFTLDGNNFTGTCRDCFTETYFNQAATVEGTFVLNLISYIKRYPGLLMVDEKEQPIIVPDRPSPEIHYTGLLYKGLFSSTLRFEGEWTMTGHYLNKSGKKEFYTCNGTWEMKK